jgi:hypothetical protein
MTGLYTLETVIEKKSYKIVVEGVGQYWTNVPGKTIGERALLAYHKLLEDAGHSTREVQFELENSGQYEARVRIKP